MRQIKEHDHVWIKDYKFNFQCCEVCGVKEPIIKIVLEQEIEALKKMGEQLAPSEQKSEKQMKNQVICAAVKATNGTIIRGYRHADCIRSIRDMGLKVSNALDAQGFITSENKFVSREQGRKIQDAAGIKSVAPEGYCGNTLFSEDLY